MFCLKDVDGRYVQVNRAFAERVGRRRAVDVVGRTAMDLFPEDLARRYEAQDRAVLASGIPVRDMLEQITRPDGNVGWYVTNKVLVQDGDSAQRSMGIASISVDLRTAISEDGDFLRMATTLDFLRKEFTGRLSVAQLAEVAGFTEAQLDRRVRRLFGFSTRRLITRTRVEQAALLLATTDLRVADVAVSSGFYDHSQLNRQFKTLIGVSPSAYRSGVR